MSQQPCITEILVAPIAGGLMQSKDCVRVIEQMGIKGDRYAVGAGHYSNIEGWGAQVTLIQSEAIAAVNEGHETDYSASMLRRNLVTQGIKLKELLGREFRCGSAVLRGTKPFPPCMRLAMLINRKDVLQYFSYSAGIGADVISSGEISLADEIVLL